MGLYHLFEHAGKGNGEGMTYRFLAGASRWLRCHFSDRLVIKRRKGRARREKPFL